MSKILDEQIGRINLCWVIIVASSLFGADSAQSKQEEEAWRAKRTAALLAPDGWFSLVGLDWLRPGKTTVGTAKDNTIQLTGDAAAHVAVFDLEGQQVQLSPPAGGFPAGLTLNGKPAQAGLVSEDTPLKIGTLYVGRNPAWRPICFTDQRRQGTNTTAISRAELVCPRRKIPCACEVATLFATS